MGTLVIGGTTASGKSSLAIELAQLYNAVIVSADAMTVYRGLNIGTAKPDPSEMELVQHFGIDTRDIDQECDVSDFCALVKECQNNHRNVIIAGGTTFWLSALVRPLADLPASVPSIRKQFEDLLDPHDALRQIDPEAALRLHPNDRVRIIRALEVHKLSGKTQTQLHQEGAPYPPIEAEVAWLDQDDLAERIHLRVIEMVKEGYVAEVASVLKDGWPQDAKPLRSFSYKHMIDHHNEEIDLEESLRRTERDTRYFAKKQRNWARSLGWEKSTRDDVFLKANVAFS
jgi:tRNA dimethylallyltransferase